MTRNQFLLIFISIILMSCSSLTDRPDKSLKKVSAPSGDFFGIENEENYIFKGIPYAQAPVGDLRWKAPREYTPTKSIYATDFGNECVQPGDDYVLGVYRRSNTIGEEDCLYLNIFIPKKGEVLESNSFPVMFWIHGGANIYGSANTYDFQNLIKKDVIVVSINYRLGPFGWFSSDFIRDDASGLDLTSNFAHLDMIQALKWVKQNISKFGGDPNNITLFGESAGGHNILALLASPLSKGLFQKAISQSGYSSTYSLEEATSLSTLSSEKVFEEDIKFMTKSSEIVEYLKELSHQEIYARYEEASDREVYPILPVTVRDGIVIPKKGILRSLEQVDPNVTVLAGTNRDEMNFYYIRSDYFYDTTLEIRRNLKRSEENLKSWIRYRSDIWRNLGAEEPLRRMSKNNANLYSFRFDWDEQSNSIAGNYALYLGAAHAMEIPFLLGDFEMQEIPFYLRSIVFPNSSLSGAKALSEDMMTYWSNVAKYGNPNSFGNTNWEKFTENNQSFLVLDNPLENQIGMVNDPVVPEEFLKELESDTTLELKERCLISWIAVEYFSEFTNPSPPFSFCRDYSDDELHTLRNLVEGRD